VKVRSGVVGNSGTGLVFDGATAGTEQRGDAPGVQRPVQLHFLAEGKIEPAGLQSAWQKIAERLSNGNGTAEHVKNGNGNGAGHRMKRRDTRRCGAHCFLRIIRNVNWYGVFIQR
jgi:hypothetical protein